MPFIKLYDCSNCDNVIDTCNQDQNYKYFPKPPIQCAACESCPSDNCHLDKNKIYLQKQIQNTVRVPGSLYLNNLEALTIKGSQKNLPKLEFNNVNQSQASDRNILHVQKASYNPRLRPGKLGPGGEGVDIKHNSFNRILARKKAEHLKTSPAISTTPPTIPKFGNKVRKLSIVYSNNCNC